MNHWGAILRLALLLAAGFAGLALLGSEMAGNWPQPPRMWPQPWPQPPAEQVTFPRPVSASARSYAEAHRQYRAGRPLVIFLTAPWCAACQRAKTQYPRLRRIGALATINVDEDPELAASVQGVKAGETYTIPRVIVFRAGMPTRVYGPEQLEQVR